MQVEIVETYTEFEKLKSSWDAVYETDPEAQFFVSWTWLSQVFSTHKTGWFILAVKAGSEYAEIQSHVKSSAEL